MAKLVNEVELSNDEQEETDEDAEVPKDDRVHAAVLATLMNKQELRAKYESKDYPDFIYPKNFLEALRLPDWREWVEAYRKEWDMWVVTNSYAVVKRDEIVPWSIVTRLYMSLLKSRRMEGTRSDHV